jgi:hypothetical protein
MVTTASDTRVRTLGLACAASGGLMTLLSLAYFWRDDSVPPSQWSYPQSSGVFLVVSVLLVIAHAMSACGYWGMYMAGAVTSRIGKIGVVASAVALLALSVCELLSGLVGGRDTDTAAVTLISSLFGAVSILFAAAAIVAGVALLRNGAGMLGWLVILTGLVIIVFVTPANISGSLIFRQLSLLIWSLLFVPLGLKVARL